MDVSVLYIIFKISFEEVNAILQNIPHQARKLPNNWIQASFDNAADVLDALGRLDKLPRDQYMTSRGIKQLKSIDLAKTDNISLAKTSADNLVDAQHLSTQHDDEVTTPGGIHHKIGITDIPSTEAHDSSSMSIGEMPLVPYNVSQNARTNFSSMQNRMKGWDKAQTVSHNQGNRYTHQYISQSAKQTHTPYRNNQGVAPSQSFSQNRSTRNVIAGRKLGDHTVKESKNISNGNRRKLDGDSLHQTLEDSSKCDSSLSKETWDLHARNIPEDYIDKFKQDMVKHGCLRVDIMPPFGKADFRLATVRY